MIIRVLIAALAAALMTSAHAQTLPDQVAQAYQRYSDALAERDYEQARDLARTAWREAVRLDVDAETTAILADNFAVLAGALGQHSEAQEAYLAAAELLEQIGREPEIVSRTYALAASSALAAGERRVARRLSDRAGDIAQNAEGLDRDVRAELIFSSRSIQASAHWGDGQIVSAAARASEAMRAADEIDLTENENYGLMAFILGAKHSVKREFEDAAFRLTQAYAYMPQQRELLRYWVDYARDQLSAEEREAQLDLVAELQLSTEQLPPDEPDAELAALQANPGFVDAVPSRRVPPQYPPGAARAGFDGVALVRFTVDAGGRVEDIEVLLSLPFRDFGEESVEAMRRWRYTPASLDGEPIARPGAITQLEFALED